MSEEVEIGQSRALIDEALARVVAITSPQEQTMPTKWVVVVEYMNAQGEPWCMRFGSEGVSLWDRMGLLAFGLACEEQSIE